MSKASADKAEQILARFPGPVTLHISRKKWLLVLLGCVAFTAAGIWMIVDGKSDGWGVTLFFGAGVIVSAIVLVPGASQLTLDANGFAVTNMFRRFTARWQDVSGFVPETIPFSRKMLVGYNDVSQKQKMLAELNVGLTGRNCALT